jgi:hypothetical protein
MAHLNYTTLVDWVNEEFKRLEITHVVAYKAERTYFTTDQYEGGACRMRIYFKSVSDTNTSGISHYFMCFYPLKHINECIKEGYKMYLNFSFRSNRKYLNELEIQLKK